MVQPYPRICNTSIARRMHRGASLHPTTQEASHTLVLSACILRPTQQIARYDTPSMIINELSAIVNTSERGCTRVQPYTPSASIIYKYYDNGSIVTKLHGGADVRSNTQIRM